MFRGVADAKGAEHTRSGGLGGGDYGKGQYWGKNVSVAQNYMQSHMGDDSGIAMRGAIDMDKKPKIREIPNKLLFGKGGSEAIDKWAEENKVDVVDVGNYRVVKNPAVMVMDSHNYTSDETVVLDYVGNGYELPPGEQYLKAAENLGMTLSAKRKRGNPYRDAAGRLTTKDKAVYDIRIGKLSSRASRLSALERRIIKDSDECIQCRENNDPRNVPVHPNCHCNVITDSVESGVADSESRFFNPLDFGGDIEIEVIGSEPVDAQGIQLDPETTAVLDAENVRWADLTRWLEQMQPYLNTGDQLVSIVVDDDTDEALAQIEETVSIISEDSEQLAEALQNRKLWFALAKAVVF